MSFTDNHNLTSYAALCLLTLLAFGCASTAPLTPNSVQYIDPELIDGIVIDSVQLGSTNVGNSQLNIRLRNDFNHPLMLEVRASWYNKNFVATEASTAWQRAYLNAGETYFFDFNAAKNTSTHYVLNIRTGGG